MFNKGKEKKNETKHPNMKEAKCKTDPSDLRSTFKINVLFKFVKCNLKEYDKMFLKFKIHTKIF